MPTPPVVGVQIFGQKSAIETLQDFLQQVETALAKAHVPRQLLTVTVNDTPCVRIAA